MSKLKSLFIAVTLAASLTMPAYAEQKTGTQMRASGPDIYRIELRNMGLFGVRAKGEPDSDGELHSISISLLEPARTRDRQYHSVVERAPLLVNTSTNEVAGKGYLTVRTGDFVRLGQRRNNESAFNLWIHSAYRNTSPGPYLSFWVTVTGTELDCSGQRVCNRGNIGSIFYEIRIPRFRNDPPRECGASNTFRWTRVDDTVTLQGNDNLQGAIVMIKSYEDERDFVGFDTKSIGPFLELTNAEVCVARTW